MKSATATMNQLLGAITLTLLAGCSCTSRPAHFNQLAMQEDAASPDVIPFLSLSRGDVLADLGAGGGYFSVRLARAVAPEGRVYAVDIDPAALAFIQAYSEQAGVGNVIPVRASFEASGLAEDSIDLIFIRNAYHDFRDRVAYFSRLRTVLTSGGRIAIIDYDPAKLGFIRKLFGHALAEEEIIDEMTRAGYRHVAGHDFLARQSFNIFSPK